MERENEFVDKYSKLFKYITENSSNPLDYSFFFKKRFPLNNNIDLSPTIAKTISIYIGCFVFVEGISNLSDLFAKLFYDKNFYNYIKTNDINQLNKYHKLCETLSKKNISWPSLGDLLKLSDSNEGDSSQTTESSQVLNQQALESPLSQPVSPTLSSPSLDTPPPPQPVPSNISSSPPPPPQLPPSSTTISTTGGRGKFLQDIENQSFKLTPLSGNQGEESEGGGGEESKDGDRTNLLREIESKGLELSPVSRDEPKSEYKNELLDEIQNSPVRKRLSKGDNTQFEQFEQTESLNTPSNEVSDIPEDLMKALKKIGPKGIKKELERKRQELYDKERTVKEYEKWVSDLANGVKIGDLKLYENKQPNISSEKEVTTSPPSTTTPTTEDASEDSRVSVEVPQSQNQSPEDNPPQVQTIPESTQFSDTDKKQKNPEESQTLSPGMVYNPLSPDLSESEIREQNAKADPNPPKRRSPLSLRDKIPSLSFKKGGGGKRKYKKKKSKRRTRMRKSYKKKSMRRTRMKKSYKKKSKRKTRMK